LIWLVLVITKRPAAPAPAATTNSAATAAPTTIRRFCIACSFVESDVQGLRRSDENGSPPLRDRVHTDPDVYTDTSALGYSHNAAPGPIQQSQSMVRDLPTLPALRESGSLGLRLWSAFG
jgi:hypothetical protein